MQGFEGVAVAVALPTGVAVPEKTLGSVTVGTPGSVDPPLVGLETVWVDFGTVVTVVDCGDGEAEATVDVTVMVCAGADAVTVTVAGGAGALCGCCAAGGWGAAGGGGGAAGA